jgi:hypothetical protein
MKIYYQKDQRAPPKMHWKNTTTKPTAHSIQTQCSMEIERQAVAQRTPEPQMPSTYYYVPSN